MSTLDYSIFSDILQNCAPLPYGIIFNIVFTATEVQVLTTSQRSLTGTDHSISEIFLWERKQEYQKKTYLSDLVTSYHLMLGTEPWSH